MVWTIYFVIPIRINFNILLVLTGRVKARVIAITITEIKTAHKH